MLEGKKWKSNERSAVLKDVESREVINERFLDDRKPQFRRRLYDIGYTRR